MSEYPGKDVDPALVHHVYEPDLAPLVLMCNRGHYTVFSNHE